MNYIAVYKSSHKDDMELFKFINVICLCTVNGVFTLAGTLLNVSVIIVLARSKELRRGTCHFMIFLLSCFDLPVIMIGHPATILGSFGWAFEDKTTPHALRILRETHVVFQGFAFGALLAMNIDRYVAIAHPFFHHASLSKKRLVMLMVIIQLVQGFLPSFRHVPYSNDVTYVVIATINFVVVFSMCFMNYKMFAIGKRIRQATPDGTRPEADLKKNSTCVLVISCFLVCTTPLNVYTGLRFGASSITGNGNFGTPFRLWAVTLATLNSSFNCVILFWRKRLPSPMQALRRRKRCPAMDQGVPAMIRESC